MYYREKHCKERSCIVCDCIGEQKKWDEPEENPSNQIVTDSQGEPVGEDNKKTKQDEKQDREYRELLYDLERLVYPADFPSVDKWGIHCIRRKRAERIKDDWPFKIIAPASSPAGSNGHGENDDSSQESDWGTKEKKDSCDALIANWIDYRVDQRQGHFIWITILAVIIVIVLFGSASFVLYQQEVRIDENKAEIVKLQKESSTRQGIEEKNTSHTEPTTDKQKKPANKAKKLEDAQKNVNHASNTIDLVKDFSSAVGVLFVALVGIISWSESIEKEVIDKLSEEKREIIDKSEYYKNKSNLRYMMKAVSVVVAFATALISL